MGNDRQSQINVSDQRYYHVAALIPRAPGFGLTALRSLVGSEFPVSEGRLSTNFEHSPHRIEALCIQASANFAESEDARKAMAVRAKGMCAYDAFLAEIRLAESVRIWPAGTKSLLVIGTGYAGLTRHVFGRLSRHSQLLKRSLFAVPNLAGIVAMCRARRRSGSDVTMTLTGVSTLRPGGKFVRGIRFSGKDVLAGGILEAIEAWMHNTPDAELAPETEKTVRNEPGLAFQNLRIRCDLSNSADAATLTIARDGSTKLWMRAQATSVVPFAASLAAISAKQLFTPSAEQPRWAEEAEF